VKITGATDIAGNQRIVIEGAPPAPPTPTLAPGGAAAPGATASATPGTTAAPGAAVVPSGTAVPPAITAVPTGEPNPQAPQPTVTATAGPGGFNPAGPGQGTVVNPQAVNEGTQVVLTGLTDDVRSGLTYPLVLTFEKAGEVRIAVPVALSTEDREDEPAG
jgi:hypothetical protein